MPEFLEPEFEHQPEDWEPEGNCIYECGNCGLIFAQPESVLMNGRLWWRCPECYSTMFYALNDQFLAMMFIGILGQNFDEGEILMLRMIADDRMGEFNPLSRFL